MVQDTKLTFSREELDVMMNSRFFLVKNDATQKIVQLFGELEKELLSSVSVFPFLMSNELQIKEKGKIFRGENYRLMPYLILDYPRVFNSQTVFAFRSMFRWGHEFSFTLHLQGESLELFRKNIQNNLTVLNGHQFYFCVNNTPWEYTFDESNYIRFDTMLEERNDELQKIILENNFIKLSRKLDLADFEKVISFGVDTFESLMTALKN